MAFPRNPDALDHLKRGAGDRLRALRVDITDHTAAETAIAELERDFGGVDVLVNNASYGLLGGVEETSDAEMRDIFEVNFFAAAALTRVVLPGMRARGRGYIVNISSVSGVHGLPGSGYYAATKFALEGLTEALRREGLDVGVNAMIVEPGPFRTGFLVGSRKHTERRIEAYTVLAKRRAAEAAMDDDVMQDPARGFAAIIEAMEAENPPERLPLGGWAADLVAQRYRERLEEAERWRALAASADRPGTVAPSGEHLERSRPASVDVVERRGVS